MLEEDLTKIDFNYHILPFRRIHTTPCTLPNSLEVTWQAKARINSIHIWHLDTRRLAQKPLEGHQIVFFACTIRSKKEDVIILGGAGSSC